MAEFSGAELEKFPYIEFCYNVIAHFECYIEYCYNIIAHLECCFEGYVEFCYDVIAHLQHLQS